MLDQIEDRMAELGLRGVDLARALNVTPQRVSDLRKGRYDIKLSTLEGVADALGCVLMLVPKERVDSRERDKEWPL
jgi:DNA-binding Xre family transcriptional regulator